MEFNFSLLVGLAIGFAVAVLLKLQEINTRCRKIELQFASLLMQIGVAVPKFPLPSAEVSALIAQPQQHVDAIKLYRQQTGLGLKEAAEAIEYFARTRETMNSTMESGHGSFSTSRDN